MQESDYEEPFFNAGDEEIQEILRDTKVIAVVGLSRDHAKDSYRVASYLQEHGYRIIPVNPSAREILHERCYADLRDVSEKIDIVNIFRPIQDIPAVVESAIAVQAKVVWMQERLVHNPAAQRAREAGVKIVMDRCLMKQHKKFEIDSLL